MLGARSAAPAAAIGAGAEAPPIGDWTLRVFDAVPAAPVWTGIGLVFAYVLLALGVRALADAIAAPSPVAALPWVWEFVNGLLVATPLTLNACARRGALADLGDLRGSLDASDSEFARVVAETTCPPAAWLAIASGGGVVLMLAVVLFDPSLWGARGRPGPTDPRLYWSFLHNAAAGYAVGRMLAMEGALTRGYARIAGRVRIELLDPESLAPLARKGQRSVLFWVLLSSVTSLFWFGGDPAVINAYFLVFALAVAATAFTLPLARVRGRIAAEKRAELDRTDRALREERAARLAGRPAPAGRVADLVAWRRLVEGVAEWPVSLPTLLRSGLFVAIAIGSWLGGALVERLVEDLLP